MPMPYQIILGVLYIAVLVIMLRDIRKTEKMYKEAKKSQEEMQQASEFAEFITQVRIDLNISQMAAKGSLSKAQAEELKHLMWLKKSCFE